MNRSKGSYTPTHNPGATYEYEITWLHMGDELYWDAVVQMGGSVVGTPGGCIMRIPSGTDAAELLKLNVQDAIDAGFPP